MAIIAVVMMLGAAHVKSPLAEAFFRRSTQNAISLALITRVPDADMFSATFSVPDPDIFCNGYFDLGSPWVDSLYFRSQHLSIFSTDLYPQLNEPFASVYPVAQDGICQGRVDETKIVPDNLVSREDKDSVGLKISGWTVDARWRWPVRRVILTAGGKIVGFGAIGSGRRDVALAFHTRRAFFSGWVGYARVPMNTSFLDVYGQVYGTGGICKVTSIPVPK
jgi:hypothetical protein